MIFAIVIVACFMSAIPAAMVWVNRDLFTRAIFPSRAAAKDSPKPKVSVLIPARDEASSIAASVSAALNSSGVEVEVVVMDDGSTDATADIVLAMAQRDTRVRLIQGDGLPEGWNGKQHACWRLAQAAEYSNLLFLDADVRLSPDAIERLIAQRDQSQAALFSTFPYQETDTFLERLLIPLMHFILLGFLPLGRMRTNTDPSMAAGCGQVFLTDQESYQAAGTHQAIRSSRHDGLKLPRAYRQANLSTDVCDGTDIATCRMYHNAGEVLRGLLKNATEGIGNPKLIVPFSIMLLAGSVLPFVVFPFAIASGQPVTILLSFLSIPLAWIPRFQCAIRYRQSLLGAVLHPLAVAIFVGLQWIALAQSLVGKQVAWRGRTSS